MDDIDVVVIGAGAVGLAVARALALAGREVLVLERERVIGSGVSARNSEVIHAGLYYAPGSLKARLCLEGKEKLYDFCESHGVAYRRCGKLIVAVAAGQIPALEAIARNAQACGVQDLVWLDGSAAARLEPALAATAALLSSGTGIIDSRGFMLALQGDAEGAGAVVAFATRVTRMALEGRSALIWMDGGAAPTLRARLVVNAAGLDAIPLARTIGGFPSDRIPRAYFAKGSYFTLFGRSPFGRLIYPVPEQGGLGIHLTLDLAGQARFGPDVEWLETDDPSALDHAVDPGRAVRFEDAIRRYWPGLPDGALGPSHAGVRPKLSGPGEQPADFRIDGAPTHGVSSIINLFGIESPGLTASLAIADQVAALADQARHWIG
jgi:L-2-hydroxyglutarate oxidase LhgO